MKAVVLEETRRIAVREVRDVSIHMGRDDDERWNRKLREMIVSGAAKPSRIVSHRISLDEAPTAFAKFDAREQGYIKVVLKLA